MRQCSPALMPKVILFFSVAISAFVQVFTFLCAGNSFPFGILPKGDQYVRYGSSLTLYCMLNTSDPAAVGRTSQDLSFFFYDEYTRLQPNSTILNETTISTVLEGLSLGEHYIYCSLKKDTKEDNCPTSVQVGYEPQLVTNFSCVSLNWVELVCRWYPPETYIKKTEYNLNYTIPTKTTKYKGFSNHSAGAGSGGGFICPKVDPAENMCKIDSQTEPFYRQSQEYFIFHLTGENPLGKRTTDVLFHNFAHVLPNKPENIGIVNKTLGSAFVSWSIPFPVNNLPYGVRSKIEYRSQWDPPNKWKEIQVNETVEKNSKTRLYNITNLEYAHAHYDVRIYLQSRAAVGDTYWSEPGTLTFTTPSTIPGRAPKTTFGSFHMTFREEYSDVLVYWNRIPESMENGEEFGYNVTCIVNNKYSCDPPIEKTLSYAKYSISNNNEYLFTIYSVNNVGRSADSSKVFVPKLGSLPRPESFTNVPYANGVHELSWKPVDRKNLSNYTIFWCEDDESSPLPCKGTIDWIDVDKNVTETNITVKSTQMFYKFAIAANFKDGSSSGMVWLSCFVLHDKADKKVDDLILGKVDSREADIIWQVECAKSSSFGGYYIYYCPALSTQNNSCQEPDREQREVINEFGKRNTTLRNLKPYTTYRVQISIKSYNGTHEKIGPRSKSLRFTTLEDAPSEPLNLRKLSATNSTVTLAWDVPLETNGVLQKYILDIKSKSSREGRIVTIEAKDSNNSLKTAFVITELSSFTSYNLTLRACTRDVKCSKPSVPIVVTTRASYPGKMTWPRVLVNDTVAYIAWEPPSVAAGQLNYYELMVSNNGSDKIVNFTGKHAEVPLTDCNTAFKIRAINIDEDRVYEGPWSEKVPSPCDPLAPSMALLVWIACICILIVILPVLFFIAKRGWLHCRKMKDVEVKLPPGLQSQDLDKDNEDYLHLDKWPPRPNDTIEGSLDPGIAPDEESLLGKKSEECLDHVPPFNINGKNGGDSSGCSVGRESISSSVASDNHASSDSGAEADQCMNVPFRQWESEQMASNNSCHDPTQASDHARKGSHPDVTVSFSGIDDWNSSEPAVPGYTRVGFTDGLPSDKSLPGKGYVTIASIAPPSPPQKTINECSYSGLPLDNFPLLYDQGSGVSDSEAKALGNAQINSSPCYVTLACLQERGMDESVTPRLGGVLNMSRPAFRESEVPQNLNALMDRKDEASAESMNCDSSSGDAEKGESSSRNCCPMPPYVSMMENPVAVNGEQTDYYEEEEEEEEDEDGDQDEGEHGKDGKNEGDGAILSPELEVSKMKTVSGIDSALLSKISKDSQSYSNYIPHHIFGKESLQTQ